MAAPVILVEATSRHAASGAPVLVRLAGGGGDRPYHYGGHHWRAGIANLPRAIASLEFDGSRLGGGGVAEAMELAWSPAGKESLAEVAGLYWADAPITVRVGPEGSDLPPLIASGRALDAPVDDSGTLRIPLADQAVDLKRPLLVDRWAGTGGVDGPIEWKGQVRPRAWGRCFNVPGRPLDPAFNIWCFGDPRRPWDAFVAIRDRGVPATAEDLSLLTWQGSVEATFTALRQSAPTDGGGVLCPSLASVKWWKQPTGDLRADIRGENAGGYVETAPEIAQRIVSARSTLAFAPGAVAAAVAARPAPYGWRVDAEGMEAAAVLSEMLAGVSLSWLIESGELDFRRWDWTAPVRVARSEGVVRRRLFKPVAGRKLGFRRNQAPMARGDLAAIVLAGDVTYEDGTPVEALKPAQPGADVTSDNKAKDTAAVAGRLALDVVESLDINVEAILSEALRQDDLLQVFDARTLVEGQPVGPVFLDFKRDQVDANGVITTALQLLGAKSADGTTWILDLDTVKVSPTETIGQRLTEIGAVGEDASAAVTVLHEALVTPAGGTARSILRAEADGVFSAFSLTANGPQRLGAFKLVADEMIFVDPQGGNPVTVLRYANNRWEFSADVYARRIVAGAIDFEFEGDRQLLDPSGWRQEFPGGMIMMGGRYRQQINSQTTFSIIFPRPFPNEVLSVGAIPRVSPYSNQKDLWLQLVNDPALQGATFGTQSSRTEDQRLDGFDWWAWGR